MPAVSTVPTVSEDLPSLAASSLVVSLETLRRRTSFRLSPTSVPTNVLVPSPATSSRPRSSSPLDQTPRSSSSGSMARPHPPHPRHRPHPLLFLPPNKTSTRRRETRPSLEPRSKSVPKRVRVSPRRRRPRPVRTRPRRSPSTTLRTTAGSSSRARFSMSPSSFRT